MEKVYTDEWDGFQFRAPTYLDGHFEPYKFDLVKWKDCDPYEIIDGYTGKKKIITRYFFSIGFLEWNKREQGFKFESVGTRLFEYWKDGLNKFILQFCEMMSKELGEDNDEWTYDDE